MKYIIIGVDNNLDGASLHSAYSCKWLSVYEVDLATNQERFYGELVDKKFLKSHIINEWIPMPAYHRNYRVFDSLSDIESYMFIECL